MIFWVILLFLVVHLLCFIIFEEVHAWSDVVVPGELVVYLWVESGHSMWWYICIALVDRCGAGHLD